MVKQLSSNLQKIFKELMKTNTHTIQRINKTNKIDKFSTRLRKKWKYKQLISGWEKDHYIINNIYR